MTPFALIALFGPILCVIVLVFSGGRIGCHLDQLANAVVKQDR